MLSYGEVKMFQKQPMIFGGLRLSVFEEADIIKAVGEEYLFKLDDLFWQPANQLNCVGNHLPLFISNEIFSLQNTIGHFGVLVTTLKNVHCQN